MSTYTLSLPITVNNQSTNSEIKIDIDLPKSCPYCEQVQTPFLKSSSGLERNNKIFSVIFICNKCNQHFLMQYRKQQTNLYVENYKSYPVDIYYKSADETFSQDLKECSPDFITIFSQLNIAEKHNLNYLLKLGYRKAIEFLVKDYLIKCKNEDESKVSTQQLGQCISDIDDARINNLARAASWIGNDETHYVRKHVDKDVQDLKKFLHALTALVSLEISISEANEFINKD